MRFYFTFIIGKTVTIARIGEEQFYNRNIDAVPEQFISIRLESIALQYFHRAALLALQLLISFDYTHIDFPLRIGYNGDATEHNTKRNFLTSSIGGSVANAVL